MCLHVVGNGIYFVVTCTWLNSDPFCVKMQKCWSLLFNAIFETLWFTLFCRLYRSCRLTAAFSCLISCISTKQRKERDGESHSRVWPGLPTVHGQRHHHGSMEQQRRDVICNYCNFAHHMAKVFKDVLPKYIIYIFIKDILGPRLLAPQYFKLGHVEIEKFKLPVSCFFHFAFLILWYFTLEGCPDKRPHPREISIKG